MSIYVLSTTLDMLGKVMVAFTALRVHHRVLTDHKLDKSVFLELRHEQIIGVVGVALIIFAYGLKMFEHYV